MDTDMTKNGNRRVAVENAGTKAYAETLREIEASGRCPFCIENLLRWHPEGILRKGAHWFLIRNQFKYKEAEQHFVLVSLVHAENFSDLPPEAMGETLEFFRFVQDEFGIPYGGIALRFGEPAKTGATVSHLHFHIIKPYDPETSGFEPARFRIGGRTRT
ncbi:MAG: HIT domain-containing protein [Patescibacteria group bacterium]